MENHKPDQHRGITVIMPVGYQTPEKEIKEDFILLKFGWTKAYSLDNSPEALKALEECQEIELNELDSEPTKLRRQRELICLAIDKINGAVKSWWHNCEPFVSKEEAKKYIMEYGLKTNA